MFPRSMACFCIVLSAALALSVSALKAQDIVGAGSAYPTPLYLKWFRDYTAQTGVHISYQAFGTNVAIKGIAAHTIDFGAGERPLPDEAMRSTPSLLNIPIAAHAVGIVFNLPSIDNAALRLTGPILADIYLGKITRWNDPQIVKINPALHLPDLTIDPEHPSSGSGTTHIFTTYLCTVSLEWRLTVGSGTAIHWPVGLGSSDGIGIKRRVRDTPGSIGYTESTYALANHLPCASMQNAKGKFVAPSLEATAAAANSVKLPPDLRGSIVDSPAPFGYPLVGYTYLYVYKHPANPKVGRLIAWMLTVGQRDAAGFGYAPLPPDVRRRALVALISP